MIEFNTADGEIGVYKDHIPLTTVLEPGVVIIHKDGEEKVAAVHAGFAEILGEKVTLLAELAEWPEEIDVSRAEAARERAEERIKTKAESLDLKRAEYALHKVLPPVLKAALDLMLGCAGGTEARRRTPSPPAPSGS